MKRKQGPTSTSSSPALKKTKSKGLGTGSTLSLQELLDFSQAKTKEDIEYRFKHIAQTLLHEFRLVVKETTTTTTTTTEIEFEILEAEFYLQIVGLHEDPFTHGSEEQKVSGTWCVALLRCSMSSHSLFSHLAFYYFRLTC